MSSGYNARGQQNTLPLPRPLQAFGVAVVLLLLWLLVWLRLSWPYSLDDALIHLRYADHLLHLHRITYNGSSPSFGTSSLLYVGLLASLRAVWTSPMLPRVLSSVVHVGTFLLLATVLWRDLRVSDARRTLRALLAVALLATLVAPSAVRWLDDGMETSLTFLDALLGVLLLRRLLRAEVTQGLQFAAVLFGFLTVLLRVEMLLLPFFVSLVLLFSSVSAASAAEKRSRRFMGTLPVAGAVAAAGLIFLSMHALLPDTALAKAFGFGAWRSTLHMAELTLASSFSFGVGLLLLWLLSCGTLAVSRVARWSDAFPNLLFPLLLLAALVRGQAIQGIRYFAWTLFFPLL